MKKHFALIIVAAMCIALLTSCIAANNGGKTPQNTANNSNGEYIEDTPSTPMKFSVVDTTVTEGDVFSVFVNLDAEGWTWDSFQFVMKYDNKLINVKEVKTTELTQGMISMSNLDYEDPNDPMDDDLDNMLKIAFATAEELQGGGDIVEIVCEALKAGSFTFEISEPFASREVTSKATNKKDVVEIENLAVANGTVKIEAVMRSEAVVHPVISAVDVTAKEGESVFVAISLSNVKQWDSLKLTIRYDAKILQFVDIAPAEITSGMLNLSSNDEKKGEIKLAFESQDELTEVGEIAVIEFKAISAGTTGIKLSSPYMTMQFGDDVIELEGIEVTNGTVTVE